MSNEIQQSSNEIITPDQFTAEEKQAMDAIEANIQGEVKKEIQQSPRSINFRDYSIFVCNSELNRIQNMQQLLNDAVKDYNKLKKKLNKTTDIQKVEEIMKDYPAFKPAYEKALVELEKMNKEQQNENSKA